MLFNSDICLAICLFLWIRNESAVKECPVDLLVSYTIVEGKKAPLLGLTESFYIQRRHNSTIKLILINKRENIAGLHRLTPKCWAIEGPACAPAGVTLIPRVKAKRHLQIWSVCSWLVLTVSEQIQSCLFLKPKSLSGCKEQRHSVVCST